MSRKSKTDRYMARPGRWLFVFVLSEAGLVSKAGDEFQLLPMARAVGVLKTMHLEPGISVITPSGVI